MSNDLLFAYLLENGFEPRRDILKRGAKVVPVIRCSGSCDFPRGLIQHQGQEFELRPVHADENLERLFE